MKSIVLAIVLIVILSLPAKACLTEYRVVVFKPNEEKQEILEDFAFNVSNPFNFTVTDVNLTYRNLNLHIPVMKEGEVLNSRYFIAPENFKLNIGCDIKGDAKEFKVIFTVLNGYDKYLNVKITFPKPSWLTGCENCSVVGNNVVFNETIVKEGRFSLVGKGSGTFVLNDGRIEFSVIEKANLSFSAEIQFSITKSKENDKWFAVYEVKNDKPIDFNVTVYGYVNESEPPHNLNNSKLIFVKHVTLKPNQHFNITVNSSAKSPAFFIKIKPIANVVCNVTVFPATKIGNHYVQYGLIKGFSFTIKPVQMTPPPLKPPSGGGGSIVVKQPQPKSNVKPSKSTSKPAQSISIPPTKVLPRAPSKIPLIYPVVRAEREIISSVSFGGVRINQIKADKYTIGTLLPIVFFPAWMLFPLIMSRTRVVFDSGVFSPEEATTFSRVIVPRGVEIGKVLPGDIDFDVPDFDLVKYIHEVYDVPLNSAKAIALSLEGGYPVFLSDQYSWRVAIEFGCEAYLRR
ncbi:hypothetical protein [Archaeoglobus sp.]